MNDPAQSVFWTARGNRLVVTGLVLTTLICLLIDVSLSRWIYHEGNGGARLMRSLLDNSEPFGHGIGVAWICLAIFSMDFRRRRAALSLATTALCAGTAANIIKLTVGRTRPRNLQWGITALTDTFDGWLPHIYGHPNGFSFPSAHTATAVAVAVWLSVTYPRGRSLFSGLAILVGLHRLYTGAHFASDICCGALVGWVVGTRCVLLGIRYGFLTKSTFNEGDESASLDPPKATNLAGCVRNTRSPG